ncbi:glycosyltransferase family 4 protein [Agromyces humi]|uniref:glycosyltransferase family 4 protein n=1 Tax=Agromyces humi TaxID=1766800 RepID=UPI001F3194FB|nr:glycosyltransferase family 4 protein [Agromyces humi]
MRIVILSQFYPPEPVPLPEELATALAERGHDVRVITGVPNYPTGNVYGGYRVRSRSVERRRGVVIRRVPLFPDHSANPIRRSVNYLSFAIAALSATGLVRRADVVYVYGTPLTAAVPALAWRRLFGTPFVLHVQDLWPESVTGSSLVHSRATGMAHTLLSAFARAVYASAQTTIAIAPTMLRRIESQGVPSERTALVYNWGTAVPDTSRRARPARDGHLHLVYAGNLGAMQDLETVLHACRLLEDVPRFSLRLLGAGLMGERLRVLAAELGLANVTFSGYLNSEELEQALDECDFQLIPLRNLDVFDGTIPSKLQASLSRGIPVITTVRGDVTRLVRRHRMGFTAEPENPGDLTRAIREALQVDAAGREEMSRSCIAFAERHMSREASVTAIERELQAAAGRGRPKPVSG